jgi:hypothetical protein
MIVPAPAGGRLDTGQRDHTPDPRALHRQAFSIQAHTDGMAVLDALLADALRKSSQVKVAVCCR